MRDDSGEEIKTALQLKIERECSLDQWDMFLWRPVVLQMATKQEIDTHWTITDMYDFHELQDIREALEAEQIKQMRK